MTSDKHCAEGRERPNMSWLRLTPGMQRVLLLAWTADSIIVHGRNLDLARRLQRRGLLRLLPPTDGGRFGEFALTEDARAYPPTGLKALLVRYHGCREITRATTQALGRAGMSDALTSRFWLELREPGCVPERKGSWPHDQLAVILREFMAGRPEAFISVVTIGPDGPWFEDGPTALMMADGRSMSTARRHIASTKEAFARQTRRSA